MAKTLTYNQSKSMAHVFEQTGNLVYADENYAREGNFLHYFCFLTNIDANIYFEL